MKRFLLILFCFTALVPNAQITTSTQWTWVHGDNTLDVAGVYGTQGVYGVSNRPGARDGAVSWTDISGNFWLFGGQGFGSSRGLLNDLWKYDLATNQWKWVNGSNDIFDEGEYGIKGIPDPLNRPGARNGAVSWIDAAGKLWLYGGEGLTPGNAPGFLNDLWNFDPSTEEWTWISGDPYPDQLSEFGTQGVSHPDNKPGSRSGSSSWIDLTGKLWLFGGYSYDFPVPSYSNDLWRYDPATGEWTWMKGNFILNQAGIYGTQGTPDINNNPGGRNDGGEWVDATGNLWLLGGEGLDESAGTGALNDLWRYTISTNTWTWMKGDKNVNQTGIYGTAGTPSTANKPGARFRAFTWAEGGFLWAYGGNGYGSSLQGLLHDLWRYNVASNQWTWMKGTGNVDMNSVYGSQGTGSATTRPGSRRGGVTFADPAGNLWLFGGNGYDAAGGTDLLNDLWILGSYILVPVKGLELSAERQSQKIFLTWKTEQEINMDRYSIERSKDGISYTAIGSVQATGNSSSSRSYSFIDTDPHEGNNSYRIKAYDLAGYTFSNVAVVKALPTSLSIYPNPVRDVLHVKLSVSTHAMAHVTDASGRSIKQQRISSGNGFDINVSSLPAGMYILVIIDGAAKWQASFIKQ